MALHRPRFRYSTRRSRNELVDPRVDHIEFRAGAIISIPALPSRRRRRTRHPCVYRDPPVRRRGVGDFPAGTRARGVATRTPLSPPGHGVVRIAEL